MSLKQAMLYSFNGDHDGVERTLRHQSRFAPDLGIFRPLLSRNFGGVYGAACRMGWWWDPRSASTSNLIEGRRYARQGRLRLTSSANSDFDDGILWTGLGIGVAF